MNGAHRCAFGFAVVVLGVAGVGLAGASVPDAAGVIYGCRDNRNGSLSVIDPASQTCPKGTSSLSWNQVGPQGPPGPEGATGATGAQGPAGPQGPAGTLDSLDALEGIRCNTTDPVNAGTTHVAYNNTTHAVTITCPPDTTTNATVNLVLSVGSKPSQFVPMNADGSCPAGTISHTSNCEYRYGGSAQANPPGTSYSVAFGNSTDHTISYTPGTQVTITATPSPGSFTQWGGSCQTATADSCSFTVASDSAVSVLFG